MGQYGERCLDQYGQKYSGQCGQRYSGRYGQKCLGQCGRKCSGQYGQKYLDQCGEKYGDKHCPSAGVRSADHSLTVNIPVTWAAFRLGRSIYKVVESAVLRSNASPCPHCSASLSICSGPTVPDHNSPAHPMEEGLPPGLLSSEVLNEV